MPRERQLLKRETKGTCLINVAEMWRNSDIQNQVIKEVKKFKPNKPVN